MFEIVSPVYRPVIRSDSWGDGNFGSNRNGGKKRHDGVDLVVEPGQIIYSMIDGTWEKIDYPYADALQYQGAQIANAQLRVEIWYMKPFDFNAGQFIQAGTIIGTAQDISLKYGKNERGEVMTPHIHVRVTMRAFTQLNSGRFISYDTYVDPTILIPGV